MNTEEERSDGNELSTLLKAFEDVNQKVAQKKVVVPKSDFDALLMQFESLDKNIFNKNVIELDSNNRVDEIMDVMTSSGNLDFSKKAKVNQEFSHLDYIALSLNFMQQHLEDKVNKLITIEKIFNSFNEIFIITDSEGRITNINDAALNKFGITSDSIQNISIKLFFDSYQIRNKYAIDFTNSVSQHHIVARFIENRAAKIILRVKAKPLQVNGETVYFYTVEPMEKATFTKNIRANQFLRINTLSAEETEIERREYLLGMRERLVSKPHLNISEIKMLCSINELLVGMEFKQDGFSN